MNAIQDDFKKSFCDYNFLIVIFIVGLVSYFETHFEASPETKTASPGSTILRGEFAEKKSREKFPSWDPRLRGNKISTRDNMFVKKFVIDLKK